FAQDFARVSRGLEFRFQKADVERRVVGDDLRVADELEELLRDVGEARLVAQEIVADPVHRERAVVDASLRVQVPVERSPARTPRTEFDATDLDDPMPL